MKNMHLTDPAGFLGKKCQQTGVFPRSCMWVPLGIAGWRASFLRFPIMQLPSL